MKRLDLNLVRIYVAIFEAKSVSKAAIVLSMTQPSVSYGLSRLREVFKDNLFERKGRGVTPTKRAEELYIQFRDALNTIDKALDDIDTFNPKTTRRVFRVAMSDVGAICLTPLLLAKFNIAAPESTIEIVQVKMDDLIDELTSGHIDIAVGNLPINHPSARSELLFKERYVCVVSNRHPRIKKKISTEQFIQEWHIDVVSPFSLHHEVDRKFREIGINRKVALRVQNYGVLPTILAEYEYVVTVPSALGKVFEQLADVKSLELPTTTQHFEIRALWHSKQQSSASNIWFRNLIRETLRPPQVKQLN
jgi:DNA-binding transcriptional LysR family regulator